MVMRCIAHGMPCAVVQFIKGTWVTGEAELLRGKFANECRFFISGEGFTWETQDRERDIKAAGIALAKAAEMLASGKYDLVILDEINIALRYDYITPEAVIAALEGRDPKTGAILTGRDAPQAICDYADLVSVIEEQKHPFKAGIKAQRGVDF